MLDIFNKWWVNNSVKPILKGRKRLVLEEIKKYINKRQILVLKGLRRVGKTTILYQLIDYLLTTAEVNKYNILYFSFDRKVEEINDIFDEYKTSVLQSDFKTNERYYIFFDEIQKLSNWSEKIKIYYDLYPNIKFILSGSAALELLKESKESLAGRAYYFKINPIDFNEYLKFKNIEIEKDKLKFYQDILKIEFNKYMSNCGFIEMIDETDSDILNRYFYESLLERVVYQDIPKTFSINEPEILIKIIEMVSYQPGLLADYKNIGNDLKRDQRTIATYFDYLKKTYLIKTLYNYSPNLIKSEKKLKKAYIAYPSFIFQNIDKSYLFENLFVSFIDTDYFYRSPHKQEVDLVIKKDDKLIPIEIKYKDKLKNKDKSGIIHFMKKYNLQNGIIITKNYKTVEKTGLYTINYIPGYEFLFINSPKNNLLDKF